MRGACTSASMPGPTARPGSWTQPASRAPWRRPTSGLPPTDMRIVVVGGSGLIGDKVMTALHDAGHSAVAASPAFGIDAYGVAGFVAAVATEPPVNGTIEV